MYPKLNIDVNKLEQNLNACAAITQKGDCSLMVVTKGVCADENVVKMLVNNKNVDFLADSRMKNIEGYAKSCRENNKKTLLLRIPMQSEIKEVVEYADISFNSELTTIKMLNEEAKKNNKKHDIVLMIDLGDLREGIFYQDEEIIDETVSEILKLENINLYGIGVNLTCYGAIIPKNENLSLLVEIAERISKKHNVELEMISGGNSSSIYLIEKGELPKGINNLRLGEAFLLGNDTAYETKLSGTTDETLILEAEIIELKEKPSLPIGEVGVDAFGEKPYYEDRGMMKRGIIAVGKQDTDLGSMEPVDSQMEIMGGSSDHIILDMTRCDKEYNVGDIVSFKLGYGGVLRTTTSPYVHKEYIK